MEFNKPRLLVIRLSALGDVAMAVPVLRVLAATYPELKLTVLSRGFFRPLFAELPNTTFYEADVRGRHKGLPGLIRLASELKQQRITAVADLHNVIRSKVLCTRLGLWGIPTAQIDKGRAEKKALTARKDKTFKPLKPTVQRYADVFEKLGCPVDMSNHRFPRKKELPEMAAALLQPGKKDIGIAPFAAFPSKAYPLDLLEEVLTALDKDGKYNILLFGGGLEETAILECLEKKYTAVSCVAGRLSFADELTLISHLDGMLSMDSGNAHLAALYGVPTVTLWGVTHPHAGFYPFGQPPENALRADRKKYPLIPTSVYGNRYPKGYEKAMRTIDPEDVVVKMRVLFF